MSLVKTALSTLFMSAMTVFMSAQNTPKFQNYEYEDQSIIQGMSDNGQWAAASGGENADARLINLDSHQATIISDAQKTAKVRDVTNDGSIVVGSVASKPAYYKDGKWTYLDTYYYNTKTAAWTTTKNQFQTVYGLVMSITPDGKWAVGVNYVNEGLTSTPALWNMETGKLVATPGLPTKDMSHKDQGQMEFFKVSADGKTILGCMSYSYLPTSEDLGGCFYFVYDVDKGTYKPIGFTETEKGRWTPKFDGVIVMMSASMSNNGKFVTGKAHIARDVAGTDYADEYSIPFLYDVEKDNIVAYDEMNVQDTYGSAVTNGGVVFDVTPEGNPVREWSIRGGKYWYSFTEILKQKYAMDFKTATGYSNTGTVIDISDDGKRIASFPDPYTSYVVDLPESAETITEGIKLLGAYTPSPAEGSETSHLKNISVTFGRSIASVGGNNSAKILDAEGNVVYNSVGFAVEGKTLNIRFRTGTLTAGKTYRLYIPEGTIAMNEDATQTNSDIYIMYKGRADEAVKPVSFYPTDGTAFSHIDYSTSPVLITFDTNIAIAETATAYIYRNQEEAPFCSLTLAYSENKLALYPSTTQYLYDGSTYRVEVSAGSVTDVAGNNPNEKITINYKGNYTREISPDDVILFSDNFDNGYGNFMQYCGDMNTPTGEMTNWDFSRGMAWGLVRDEESSSDRMAASHSMYDPAGESDDWLVIPQLYIPDMLCSVKFLSQSYKEDKNDTLKVIVWESNNVYNTLTTDIIDEMWEKGKLVYNKRQSPGKQEEVLGGEWTYNTIDLSEFAEKNVYIAFVNKNNNQSAIFMDSLEVRHDMTYLTTFTYEESVVNQKEVVIRGSVIGNNDEKTYDKIEMMLKDSEGKVVDTYTATGLNLKKNAKHSFEFSKPLPLAVGVENKFSVAVSLDGEKNEVKGSIKNLAFQPTKRVVLEEYTGRACGNCPLGILAVERLQERYGDAFIPISIHTYSNDPLSSGMSSYTSTLGIDQLGAPSGMINRLAGCYPAASAEVDGVARYFFTNKETPDMSDKLWADYVEEEIAVPAESGIEITDVTYNKATGCFDATCEIKYALNATNQTVNLFTVLLEDNLSQAQYNYMSSIASPDLGEWGLGGKYGQSTVTDYLHQDVCKNVNGLTINGTGGYVPSTVVAGEVYTANVSVAVPSTVQTLGECKVVVMMINANNGKVINAARMKYSDPTSVESLNSQLSTLNDNTYNLAGQLVDKDYKGIVIKNGKKYIQN